MEASNGGRIAAFSALNALVEEEFDWKSVCEIFLEQLSSFLSELERCNASHNFYPAFNWERIPIEVAALQVHSEILFALVNSWLCCKVDDCGITKIQMFILLRFGQMFRSQ